MAVTVGALLPGKACASTTLLSAELPGGMAEDRVGRAAACCCILCRTYTKHVVLGCCYIFQLKHVALQAYSDV
uniref:Secreted protein n=1 Tax=Ascaris lumbricoides TaxID=6252 RepID=A0A0M3HMU2_ASCLU